MALHIKNKFARFDPGPDMTKGSIIAHLIWFSLPLLAGNLFQQLYNTVDAWVVGNFVSNEAFSAVGTVGPIINMLIGFFLGFSSGAGIVISQYYGARRYDKVHDTVHTAIVMTLVLAVILSLAGILLIPLMLDLMKTPEEVVPESTKYLTIYFAGMVGLMLYNMGSGILRAVGDSKRPFYFLVVSAVINTVLDLLFVCVFGMGVEGVAYATIIAQGVSAFLVILSLLKSDTCVVLHFRDLRIHPQMLAKIVKIGIPSAIQPAITGFSNVFVQSYINSFGADCMGGWTAYSKIDQFVLLPMQSISIASTTFVGQNLGGGNVKRAKKGISYALVMSLASTFIIMLPLLVFAPNMVEFFNSKEEVVKFGTQFLRFIMPCYVICCVNQVYTAALRGAGNSRTPMFIMLFSYVLFRQIYLYIMSQYIFNHPISIALGYPAGWAVCSLLIFLYYRRADLAKDSVVESGEGAKSSAVSA